MTAAYSTSPFERKSCRCCTHPTAVHGAVGVLRWQGKPQGIPRQNIVRRAWLLRGYGVKRQLIPQRQWYAKIAHLYLRREDGYRISRTTGPVSIHIYANLSGEIPGGETSTW